MIDLEAVDLDAPEWSGDINNVASVMKMWLRDLPEPLMTQSLHQGFIEGASECCFIAETYYSYLFSARG